MEQSIEVIPLAGFDADGEPEIRRTADGRLDIVFNFMPPSWAADVPDAFDDFDRRMAAAVGSPVAWEDREVFRIDQPDENTVGRIKQFIESYRRP